MAPRPEILLVVAREDEHASLRHILTGGDWQVLDAHSIRHAKALLLAGQVPVAILSAGDWKWWSQETGLLPAAPKLIVSSHQAHESLWTEDLGLGCYDVLYWPYAAREVLRVVLLASECWKRESGQHLARPKPPGSASRLTGVPDPIRAGGIR